MSLWVVILLGGLITYAMRLSFIYLLGNIEVPERLRRALRFVPPAVLSAIVLPELLMPSGPVDVGPHNYRLMAGILAIVLAWRTKSAVLTILVGMIALVVLQWAL